MHLERSTQSSKIKSLNVTSISLRANATNAPILTSFTTRKNTSSIEEKSNTEKPFVI